MLKTILFFAISSSCLVLSLNSPSYASGHTLHIYNDLGRNISLSHGSSHCMHSPQFEKINVPAHGHTDLVLSDKNSGTKCVSISRHSGTKTAQLIFHDPQTDSDLTVDYRHRYAGLDSGWHSRWEDAVFFINRSAHAAKITSAAYCEQDHMNYCSDDYYQHSRHHSSAPLYIHINEDLRKINIRYTDKTKQNVTWRAGHIAKQMNQNIPTDLTHHWLVRDNNKPPVTYQVSGDAHQTVDFSFYTHNYD